MRESWPYSTHACLLLIFGVVSTVTQLPPYSRDGCCYGKSSFEHGQTVAAIPSCCLYLTCHDGDIRKQYIEKPGDHGCCEFAGLVYPNGAELGAQCVSLTCRRGEWIGSPKISECCKHCYLFNDPHFVTFDGHYYDWHGICNYTITQTGTSLQPEIGVFSDFRHCFNSASCLDVTTFKNDEHTAITLHHENPFTIEVNGDEFVVPPTGVVHVASHPVLAWRDDSCIYLLGSSKIMLQHCPHRLDVWAYPTHVNSLHGLCGHFNFRVDDDFTSRTLTVYPLQKWPLAFPESWRTTNQLHDCKSCYQCEREATEDPCRLGAAQRQALRAVCSKLLHYILAKDQELNHYVDACQFDLCQLRQAGSSKETEKNWLRMLEILVQNAKIILAKTTGEWEHLPDSHPAEGICKPGSRWKEECNWCTCSDLGTAAFCTRKGCAEEYVHPLGEDACTNGSMWKVECNWCSCIRGGFLCSRDPCGV